MAKSIFLDSHVNILMQIPDSIIKDEYYEVKIENIYDPSKFWIVVKFKELVVFMKYLKQFYDNPDHRNMICKSNVQKNLICVVHKGGMYFRSVVLPVLLSGGNLVRVFMFDFGYILNVHIDNLFFIEEKHVKVPRFAIRATLARLSPSGQFKTWNKSDLQAFCEIIQSRKLFAKICTIDTNQRILHCEIFVDSNLSITSVNDELIKLKIAVYSKSYSNDSIELTKYKTKVKYSHLFPAFEAIEKGVVPCSLWESNLLKHSVPLDWLYKDYYKYQHN